jgi:hypothetical protein
MAAEYRSGRFAERHISEGARTIKLIKQPEGAQIPADRRLRVNIEFTFYSKNSPFAEITARLLMPVDFRQEVFFILKACFGLLVKTF